MAEAKGLGRLHLHTEGFQMLLDMTSSGWDKGEGHRTMCPWTCRLGVGEREILTPMALRMRCMGLDTTPALD